MSDEINIRVQVPTQRYVRCVKAPGMGNSKMLYLDLPAGAEVPEGYELWAYSGYVAVLDVRSLDDAF